MKKIETHLRAYLPVGEGIKAPWDIDEFTNYFRCESGVLTEKGWALIQVTVNKKLIESGNYTTPQDYSFTYGYTVDWKLHFQGQQSYLLDKEFGLRAKIEKRLQLTLERMIKDLL